MIKVAINGFGRIGRILTRLLMDCEDIQLVGINDLSDSTTMAHLFKYDSVHGPWKGTVGVADGKIIINDEVINYYQWSNPEDWNWEAKPDFVFECSGKFKSREEASKHIAAGASRVIISAPSTSEDLKSVVLGVNDSILNAEDLIVSNASCTTNNAAPMIAVLKELSEIESCYITTVHSYTGDQRLHDAPHKDLRRARAAANSIVPTTTGAAKAITRIFPDLDGVTGGCGIRVPVPDGSLTDITFVVKDELEIEAINKAFKKASESSLKGILDYTEDPIVSRDIIGNPFSCVFDAQLTSVIGKMVKIVGWYDNEMGYSHRLVDLVRKMSSLRNA